MSCKKIQEWILTDYLDGQMGDKQKKVVDQHLAHCSSCKKFHMAVRQTESELFAKSERLDPPEFLWDRIKETLLDEQQTAESPVGRCWAGLKNILPVPPPAFAIASAIALILMIGVVIQIRMSGRELLQPTEYVADGTAGMAGVSHVVQEGFGTSLEEYFL